MTPDIAHPTSGGQEHLQWPSSPAASHLTPAHPRTTPTITPGSIRRTGAGTASGGDAARVAGWVCVIILLLMITATHYNGAGAVGLIATAALLVIALVWDIQRRRTAWRK